MHENTENMQTKVVITIFNRRNESLFESHLIGYLYKNMYFHKHPRSLNNSRLYRVLSWGHSIG